MGYEWPAPSTTWVTATWQDHKNRNPPSTEPGTDIGTAYGAPVVAVESGTISKVKTSNSGGEGRTVEVSLDDGRTARPLHMSEIWVSVGQRVSRGQQLGLSGASGFGDDWYYGPHVHQTLWNGPSWSGPTIDFQLYVGEGGDMPLTAADKQIIKDAIFEFMRDATTPPAGYDRWPFMAESVWNAPVVTPTGLQAAGIVLAANTLPPEQITAIAQAVVAELPDVPGGGASAEEVEAIITAALSALVLRASP